MTSHTGMSALISRGIRERGTAFTYHGVARNIGVATGLLLAAVLLVFIDWRTLAAVLIVPVVLATELALRLEFDETAGSAVRNEHPDTADADAGRGQVFSVAELRRNTALYYRRIHTRHQHLIAVYYQGAFTFLTEILAGLSLFEPVALFDRMFEPNQYVYSGLLLLGGIGQYPGCKLVDRFQAEYVVVALAFIPASTGGLVPLLVVTGLLSFLVFIVGPIYHEIISQYAPSAVRGLSFGYTYTGIFVTGALGATLSGIVLRHSSPAILFVVLAAVVGAAALVALVLLRRWQRGGNE